MKSFVLTKRISFLSVLVLVGASLFGMRCFAATPNILFIVSDDHGWGDLPSNWDNTEVQLPTLDALANRGVRFPNYHTVPLCGPSRACMFTGQYSTENGMWRGPGSQPLGSSG
ncbi:MAG: sulfatase-like hydrolase/transferase, partial [Pirellulales bacterium]